MEVKFLNDGKRNLIGIYFPITSQLPIPQKGSYFIYQNECYEVGMITFYYELKKIEVRAFCNYL